MPPCGSYLVNFSSVNLFKVSITDKPEVDGVLILPPSLHQCSILSVFKASQSETKEKVETRM